MRTTKLLLALLTTTLLFASVSPVSAAYATSNKQHRYAICHATGSQSNPYVKLTVDYHSIVKKGHDQHQGHGDIIPAIPEHNYAGQNTHMTDVYANGCKVAAHEEPISNVPSNPITPTQPTTPSAPEKTPAKPEAKTAKTHKHTICHATSSATNPYVTISVDYNSIIKRGHDQHQDHGDIIPAIPEHGYAGQNTDKLAVLENGCKPVTASAVTPTEPETPVTPETPGQGSVGPEEPVVEILDAVSTDAPAVASVATTLPQTGPLSSTLLILLAGTIAAGVSYGSQSLRKLFVKA